MNEFAARLAYRGEWKELAGRLAADLFSKLAFGSIEGVFAFGDFAFGDRPGTLVFLCPEGTTGMDEEDFETGAGVAEE